MFGKLSSKCVIFVFKIINNYDRQCMPDKIDFTLAVCQTHSLKSCYLCNLNFTLGGDLIAQVKLFKHITER